MFTASREELAALLVAVIVVELLAWSVSIGERLRVMTYAGAFLACGWASYCAVREYSVELGIAAGILGFLAWLVLAGLGDAFWRWWQPHVPVCKKGTCRNYKFHSARGRKDLYQCGCGDMYDIELTDTGRIFFEVLADGTTRPYMSRTRFGRWRPDTNEEE